MSNPGGSCTKRRRNREGRRDREVRSHASRESTIAAISHQEASRGIVQTATIEEDAVDRENTAEDPGQETDLVADLATDVDLEVGPAIEDDPAADLVIAEAVPANAEEAEIDRRDIVEGDREVDLDGIPKRNVSLIYCLLICACCSSCWIDRTAPHKHFHLLRRELIEGNNRPLNPSKTFLEKQGTETTLVFTKERVVSSSIIY